MPEYSTTLRTTGKYAFDALMALILAFVAYCLGFAALCAILGLLERSAAGWSYLARR